MTVPNNIKCSIVFRNFDLVLMLIREFSLKIFGDCVDCFQLLNGGRQLIKNGFFCLFFGDQKD
jgi:hypothetical protein